MPCIFCIAVVAMIAGAITASVLDSMEEQLGAVAAGDVERTVDSDSVAVFECEVDAGGKRVPVRVTVYKEHKRVRIQVMTHDVSRAEAERVEDQVAAALGAEIVDRSDAHDEEQVRRAFGENAVALEREISQAREQRR